MSGTFETAIHEGIKHTHEYENIFLGERSSEGWWYYYIVAFFVKTSLPVLILFLMASCIVFFRLRKEKIEIYYLLLPVLLIFVVFSIFIDKQIGLRFILPIYPFIFVLSGKVLSLKKKYFRIFLLILLVLHLISSLSVYPNYISYFNEFAGGYKNGYKYFGDANVDYGQEGYAMEQFAKSNKVVCGPVIIDNYWSVNCVSRVACCSSIECTKERLNSFDGHYYAISRITYALLPECRLFANYTPVKSLGNTIDLFNISAIT